MLKGINCKGNDWFYIDDFEDLHYDYYVARKAGYHSCSKSVLYDDMRDWVDDVQEEELRRLDDTELYVVTYFKARDGYLEGYVDFGLTKEEIVENVKAQKYVEGACYYTFGNMFWTTRKVLEGEWKNL